MTYWYIILAVVILLAFFTAIWIWAIKYTNKVISYLVFATIAYVISGKTDTYQSIITSAGVLDKNSYPFVMVLLGNLATYILSISDAPSDILDSRLSEIFMLIKTQTFSKEFTEENKINLLTINYKYAIALQKTNPKVFTEDYPEIAKIYDEIQVMISETRKNYYFGKGY